MSFKPSPSTISCPRISWFRLSAMIRAVRYQSNPLSYPQLCGAMTWAKPSNGNRALLIPRHKIRQHRAWKHGRMESFFGLDSYEGARHRCGCGVTGADTAIRGQENNGHCSSRDQDGPCFLKVIKAGVYVGGAIDQETEKRFIKIGLGFKKNKTIHYQSEDESHQGN
ncbi:hypothetical protein I7I51_08128 [Histoplasma capsulatum]|uniref:Uncharacterized protein n=1 Tax=Ajellomyces capsulatus TaxID=5037 RepID=A0A8A1LXT1_AJECA|nr:hypothetical protein I7I51_08128 [Histoplasma capsulatum]